jgi:membrane protein
MDGRQIAGALKDAGLGWMRDNATRMSAALAYYAIFSIAPLLVIVVAIVGLVYGDEAAHGQVAGQVSSLVGETAGESIQAAVAATGRSTSTGVMAAVISFAVMLFGASTVFGELKTSLNAIWGVAAKPGRAIATLLHDRFLSFALVLCIGFLLLISLVVSAVVAGVSEFMGHALSIPPSVWRCVDFVTSLGVAVVLFAMIFKILPNVALRWRDVLPGAIFTAVFFAIGKAGIAWYLGTNSVASSFAAAGSVIVILLWVYYATCILFFGAEFAKAWMLRSGRTIVPDRHGMLLAPPVTVADVK